MIKYISTRGTTSPVGFDEAVLQGFAADGGLFVPERIPQPGKAVLKHWSSLSYTELAYEILYLFIDPAIIPEDDLRRLIAKSFSSFDHPDLMPIVTLDDKKNMCVMELFHGPTLSFKDIAMGFLVNTMDYLLKKRRQHLSVILATTGDTGPAAVHAAVGKTTIDCWPLYPLGMISEEQERQMTTLDTENILPVGVTGCTDGGDDLDALIAKMFADPGLKVELGLSSVNSINWCRVMVQAVHFAYGYFRTCDRPGDPVAFSVPSGAFGNLFAGYLAREMGIPVSTFICANNKNQALHTLFSQGVFKKEELIPTVSSAIDIVVPYNFWRFLYYTTGCDHQDIRKWMDGFKRDKEIHFDQKTSAAISRGYVSCSVSDQLTLETIRRVWDENHYLLDPHGAVAVAAAERLKGRLEDDPKIVCLATAHPAKFPAIIQQALGDTDLPDEATHQSLVEAKSRSQKHFTYDYAEIEARLVKEMRRRAHNRRLPD